MIRDHVGGGGQGVDQGGRVIFPVAILEEGQPVIASIPKSGKPKIDLPTVRAAVRRGAGIVDREKLVIAPFEI